VSGGDSRIALDPASGLNRYLCPPTPDAWLVCLGSCTASPISPEGFAASHRCFDDLISATGREAVDRHARWEAKIRAAIGGYFGIDGMAEVVLQASGTDAVAWTAAAIARRAGGPPLTAIVTTPSETGTGVRLAAACKGSMPVRHSENRSRMSRSTPSRSRYARQTVCCVVTMNWSPRSLRPRRQRMAIPSSM